MKEKKSFLRGKKLYALIITASIAVIASITVIALTAGKTITPPNAPVDNVGGGQLDTDVGGTNSGSSDTDVGGEAGGNQNEPPVSTTAQYIIPVDDADASVMHGLFYNSFLDMYYHHVGIDLEAEAGSQVRAVASGSVSRIEESYLYGTSVYVAHGAGVESVYRYVQVADGISEGSVVEQGDVIATVAAATGEEAYGAHLHFELNVNGRSADPTGYLNLQDK